MILIFIGNLTVKILLFQYSLLDTIYYTHTTLIKKENSYQIKKNSITPVSNLSFVRSITFYQPC